MQTENARLGLEEGVEENDGELADLTQPGEAGGPMHPRLDSSGTADGLVDRVLAFRRVRAPLARGLPAALSPGPPVGGLLPPSAQCRLFRVRGIAGLGQ